MINEVAPDSYYGVDFLSEGAVSSEPGNFGEGTSINLLY